MTEIDWDRPDVVPAFVDQPLPATLRDEDGAAVATVDLRDALVEATARELRASDVPRLVGLLPGVSRAHLAKGPTEEPYCRLCEALSAVPGDGSLPDRVVGAAAVLDRYHQLPPFTPEGDAEAYRRCCEAYRAAGWRE